VKCLAGIAPDGTSFRESTGTTSWEKARKILARELADHDPVNKRSSAQTRGRSGICEGRAFPGVASYFPILSTMKLL